MKFKSIVTSALLLVGAAIWSNASFAGYVGDVTPQQIFSGTSGVLPGASWTFFGVSAQPSDTCSYWGRYFKFDSSTVGGKNLLAILLTAKAAGKNVDVWYSNSPKAGTDHNSGCGEADISTISNIGIQQ